MKKTILSLVTLGVIGLAIQGCKKDEVAPAATGSATIEGIVKYNKNLRNDTLPNGSYQIQPENAPAGTEVKFILDTKNLQKNQNNSYNYEKVLYVAKVDANGRYSIVLPTSVSSTPFTVQMKIESFEYNPIITSSQNTDSIGERTLTPAINRNVTIFNGSKSIEDAHLY